MKQAAALALVVSMVAAPLAQAQDDSGFYVGGQIGQGKLELKDSNFSESGVGFGAYGGYRFNSWFALEANLLVADNLDSDNLDILSGYTSIAPSLPGSLMTPFPSMPRRVLPADWCVSITVTGKRILTAMVGFMVWGWTPL